MPVAALWGVGLRIRHFLYDKQWLPVKNPPVPVVGVGNLNLGGAGKTPMSDYLIGLLRPHYRVAFLSRGYKRQTSGYVEAGPDSTVRDIGDEPLQLYRKWKGQVPVAVDEDRARGIERLVRRHHPDVIILDDAFQHRRIRPTWQILLTPFHRPFVGDWLFPAGTLRDLKSRAHAADLIVVTKTPAGASSGAKQKLKSSLERYGKPVFFAGLHYGTPRNAQGKTCSLDKLKGKILLITGIADPEPLLTELQERGVPFDHLSYPDHHAYSPKDIHRIRKKINKENYACVLTTEKDFVKLQEHLDGIHYLPIEVFMEEEQPFKHMLYESIKSEKFV